MRQLSRRRTLAAVGAGLGTALAGCTGDEPTGDDTDTTDTTRTTETTTDGSGSGNGASDTLGLGAPMGKPRWAADEDAVGAVAIAASERRARAMIGAFVGPDGFGGDVQTFLDETAFEQSALVAIQTAGPNTCYATVAVEDATVADGELTASARAVDTSGEDQACGQAITYPTVLYRATGSDDPPTAATVSVTDGWGDTQSLSATTDDPLSPAPEDLSGYVRPDGDPPAVPQALTCEDSEFERVEGWYDAESLSWGETTDDEGSPEFALRVDERAYELGDTVTITLTNVSDTFLTTGTEAKYSLEIETAEGWQDVRGTRSEDPVPYTDLGYEHPPGEGFEWRLELTDDGLLRGHENQDRLDVCPSLQPGRYRFVQWGPDVAVAFDVTE